MRRCAVAIAVVLTAHAASAACVNKFVQFRESPARWNITLLTGYLTFQEATALARDIRAKRAAPIEWVDEKGKALARQFGDLRVVRPMPVACDGKASGVIVVVTFLAPRPPVEKMRVKFDANTIVEFEEQKE